MISPIHAMLASSLFFGGVSAVVTQTPNSDTKASHENHGLRAAEKTAFAERRKAFRELSSEEKKSAGRGRWNKAPHGNANSRERSARAERPHVKRDAAISKLADRAALREQIREKKLELRQDKKLVAHKNAREN